MTYLSRGKRSIMEQEYAVDLRIWSKHFQIAAPLVQVRVTRAGRYSATYRRVTVPPNADKASLVHEFAHHVNHLVYNGKGHDRTFRVALVESATVAYGRANLYPWTAEYERVKKWALVNGLCCLVTPAITGTRPGAE